MSKTSREAGSESRDTRRPDGGFTLLEVVVAIAILGAVLGTGLELLAISLRSAKTSGDYTQAVLLARWKLDEISLQELRAGANQGNFGGGYRWTAEVAQEGQDDEGLPVRLFKLRVKVSWVGKGGDKGVELVTLRGVKEETPSPERPGEAGGRSAARMGGAPLGAQRGPVR